MQDYWTPERVAWLPSVLTLAVGTAVIVGFSGLVARPVRSAVWRRTIWQVATLALFTLLMIELTGVAPAVVQLWRTQSPARVVRAEAGPETAEEPGLSVAVRPDPARYEKTFQLEERSPAIVESPTVETSEPIDTDHRPAVFSFSSEFGEPPVYANAHGQNARGTHNFKSDEPSKPIHPTADMAPSNSQPVSHRESGCVWWPMGIWTLGFLAFSGRFLWARAMLWTFRRRQTVLDDPVLRRRVDRLARRLGIRRPVRLLKASRLSAPVAFGTYRPTVALPDEFLDGFDRRQQEAVLAHELAHLAARDPAWQLAASMLCAALWWHPLVWWSRRRLHAAGEAAADEASLLVPDGPDALASCLVAMGRRIVRPPRLGWLSVEGSGFRSSLGRRVERLLNLRTGPWCAPGRGRLAVVKTVLPAAIVILAVTCTAWARPQANPSEGETKMSVLGSSWKRSLAAAALTALLAPLSGEATAQDEPAPGTEEAAIEVLGDQLVVFQEEGNREHEEGEHEHGEGEAREHEEGEHEQGEGEDREREEAQHREGEDREHREAEEREQRERAEAERGGNERLEVMMRQLDEKAADIRRRLEGLKDGEDEAARELQAALRQIRERADAIRREFRGGEADRERREVERSERARHMEELKREHAELQERSMHLQRELKEAPDQEGARGLHDELREIQQRMQQLEREARGGEDRERRDPDRGPEAREAELRRHLEELEREIGRLSEAGKHEEAGALKRRGREMLEQFRRQQQQQREPQRPGPPEDLERRVHHLKVAIENLHAAGLHDQAEALAGQVERMVRGAREGDRRPDEPREPRRPDERREGPPRPDQMERIIDEFHGEMQRMRREMDELRGMVKELLERERIGR